MKVDKAIKYLQTLKRIILIDQHWQTEHKELDQIIDLLKSLEAENKTLKKENKAYKGYKKCWENIFKYRINKFPWDKFIVKSSDVRELEKLYLGGQNEQSRT